MKRVRLALLASIVSLTAVIATCWLVHLLRYDLSLSIGVIGVEVTILAVLFQEALRPQSRTRQIVFLGKSNSFFSQNIMRGLQQSLSGAFPHRILEILPTAGHDSENLAFQISALGTREALSADCLVIVPVADHEDLWKALHYLAQVGVFIVLIDHKTPNRVFYESGVRMPSFIGSDFELGGRLVASAISEELSSGAKASILLLGPRSSTPAFIRGSTCLHELSLSGNLPVFEVAELRNWDTEEALRSFSAAYQRLCKRLALSMGDHICVFAGNDKNALALDLYLASSNMRDHKFTILGYDGIRGPDGCLLAAASNNIVATVDTLPASQGFAAGRALISAYNGSTPQGKNSIVRPMLLSKSSWK